MKALSQRDGNTGGVTMAATARAMQLGDVIRFGNGKAIKPGGEGRYPVYGSNGIIGGCDELVENSQRRIRILEAKARALYREWFGHFRFPGHEKHPRVASPLGDIHQG